MSEHRLAQNEALFLQRALDSDYRTGGIRLRQGEYQYTLAEAIAEVQLQLSFPDAKELIEKLYGKEKIEDIQFVRKIQTILKKMEKSGVLSILPKKKPWELQRYGLIGFRFRDSDNNLVTFATDDQIKKSQLLLQQLLKQRQVVTNHARMKSVSIVMLLLALAGSYGLVVWSILQPVIDPLVITVALASGVLCAVVLGRVFSG